MTALNYAVLVTSMVWCILEIVVAVIRRSKPWSLGQDRLSYWVVWLSFLLSILAAVGMSKLDSVGRMSLLAPFIGYVGCLVIAAGVVIRWTAVATLGRYFTLQVAIVKDHKMIDRGIYGTLRHPAYLGSLTSFVGLGLAMENWITLLVVLILPLGAVLYRISVEEKVLRDHFGMQYEEYCKGPKNSFRESTRITDLNGMDSQLGRGGGY
jgi:protein-S-isoprenylcysteine O-methyltransferase Ste14